MIFWKEFTSNNFPINFVDNESLFHNKNIPNYFKLKFYLFGRWTKLELSLQKNKEFN